MFWVLQLTSCFILVHQGFVPSLRELSRHIDLPMTTFIQTWFAVLSPIIFLVGFFFSPVHGLFLYIFLLLKTKWYDFQLFYIFFVNCKFQLISLAVEVFVEACLAKTLVQGEVHSVSKLLIIFPCHYFQTFLFKACFGKQTHPSALLV